MKRRSHAPVPRSGHPPSGASGGWWRSRWNRWWEQRLPRRDEVTFRQGNLYVLPSKAGWGFTATLLILLLASINEQINLGYALTFLLSGASLVSLFQAHANLRGLRLRLLPASSVHAGQALTLNVALDEPGKSSRRGRHGLRLSTAHDTRHPAPAPVECELSPQGETVVGLDVPTHHRGWLNAPRVSIETRYPLGLFTAWGYWRPASPVLIWPALEPLPPPLPEGLGQDETTAVAHRPRSGGETPEGLRNYRRGDSLRLIAWKKSSHALVTGSGAGLISREASSGHSPDLWLDWSQGEHLAGLDAEARLSRLASWVILAEEQAQTRGRPYGLRLPGKVIECGQGASHERACLDALALWGGT